MTHTDQVGHVAEEPDQQKSHAQALGALRLVVGDQLRELQKGQRVSDGERVERRTLGAAREMTGGLGKICEKTYQEADPGDHADAAKDAGDGLRPVHGVHGGGGSEGRGHAGECPGRQDTNDV